MKTKKGYCDVKRLVVSVDELKYFALAREIFKKHSFGPKPAIQKIVDEYCNNQESRELIDQVLGNSQKGTIQQPLNMISHELPKLNPIPESVELSRTEKRQVDYLTRKFRETEKKISMMDGTESNYQYMKDKALSLFDSRMYVILGV